MNIDLLPHKALIKALADLYPLRTPDWKTPLDQIRYESGQRSVVDRLLEVLQDQEETSVATQHSVLGIPHV